MPKKPAPLDLSEDQVRFFRARRSHLVGPGGDDVATTARDLLGAQAQVETCGLHALSLRTRGRPTAAAVQKRLVEEPERDLVRTWGQRDTLHIYASDDWASIIAAQELWVRSGRRGGMPPDSLVETTRQHFLAAGEPLTRSDLFDLVPNSYAAELATHPGAGTDPRRFAGTRLIWVLSKEGFLGRAYKRGSEQAYVARSLWFPDLAWDTAPPVAAATALCRRYLATWGPATATDVAHYFGSRVGDAHEWLARLEPELLRVACGGRKGLVALKADAEALRADPDAHAWPARLLPPYDTALMTHKDKSWICTGRDEEKLVWRKAAVVCASVVARGRIVALWTHNVRTHEVDVEITPMALWDDRYRGDVEHDAAAFAAHLGLELGTVAG